jgi:hypothetical protein
MARDRFLIILALVCVPVLVCAQSFKIEGLPDPKAPCAGDLQKQYPEYPWDFTTNSRGPIPTDRLGFLHCVHNNAKNVIDVNWRIPQVMGPIAPQESQLGPRHSANGAPLGVRDGCLVYGNLHDHFVTAEFWARTEDRDALDKEMKQGDCLAPLQKASLESDRKVSLTDLSAPFRLFFPQNPMSQEANLIAFEGVAGVKATSPKSYESFLQYRLRSTSTNEPADLSEYILVPNWAGPAKALLPFYDKARNQPLIPLKGTGSANTIRFSVEGSETWSFQEIEFRVWNAKGAGWTDPKGVAVATLYVPAFVPY